MRRVVTLWLCSLWLYVPRLYLTMAVPYPTKVGNKNVRRVVKLTRTDNFTVAHRFEQRRYRPSTSQMKYSLPSPSAID